MNLFKKAIKQMLEDNEFEKIINYSCSKEREHAEKFYELAKQYEKIPAICLITNCKSYMVLQDIVCYMSMLEKKGQQ